MELASDHLLVLHFVELCVEPFQAKKVLVTANFLNRAFVQHDDFVGFLNGREPVGDDYGGTVAHHLADCFLDHLFCF